MADHSSAVICVTATEEPYSTDLVATLENGKTIRWDDMPRGGMRWVPDNALDMDGEHLVAAIQKKYYHWINC